MKHARLIYLPMIAVMLAGVALAGAGTGTPAPARAADFADTAFLQTWMRTDEPVAAGVVQRSWYWGPTPRCSTRETYVDAPDGSGTRLVQYFDKSRMEINNPNGDPSAPWYVTNGLLAYEMISGLMQIGNNTYQTRGPADIPIASDMGDLNAPTYRSFQSVSNTPAAQHYAPSALGQPVLATIDRAGNVGVDPAKAYYPNTAIAHYNDTTHHNIPTVFWNFINQTGPIFVGGQLQQGALSEPADFVTGFPISEAYWARVLVNGTATDVMIQAFQRRVLTYIPALAPPWNVQMGNVGAHYLLWRYGDHACQAIAPAPPTVTPVPPAPPNPQPNVEPLYRLYNPRSGEHFYTIDPAEVNALLHDSYVSEGTEGRVWNTQVSGSVPFYRLLLAPVGGPVRHMYTTSVVERNVLIANGWKLEYGPGGGPGAGYVYNSQAPQTVPLYRWYNPKINDHLFTLSSASLTSNGYYAEGIAAYVVQP